MQHIHNETYKQLAEKFKLDSYPLNYFSGIIYIEDTPFVYKLSLSVIINNEDLIPVWWEFDTSTDHYNDFDFNLFKLEYLKLK